VAFFNLLERICVVVPLQTYLLVLFNLSSERTRRSKATYEVTGMSPQSTTLAQELNGFAASGTLYPPLNPILREPLDHSTTKVSMRLLSRKHTKD
jgi:hypothetical protein